MAFASDADATTNAITYSLDDDAGGRFAIDSNSGVVRVADGTQLDYEAAASHGITVRATSADGSFSMQSMTINLTDVDEFDVGTINDINAADNQVAENAANGTTVGITSLASDADGTTNTITYSLDDDANGTFAIDANSGVVTVADNSQLDYGDATSHEIVIRATSADTSFNIQTMTINVTNVIMGLPPVTEPPPETELQSDTESESDDAEHGSRRGGRSADNGRGRTAAAK
jgi:phage baseplate assembly protein gpV